MYGVLEINAADVTEDEDIVPPELSDFIITLTGLMLFTGCGKLKTPSAIRL